MNDIMHTEVLRAIPPAPAELTARQIFNRVGGPSFATIRHTLRELAESGQVIRSGDLENPTYRRAG